MMVIMMVGTMILVPSIIRENIRNTVLEASINSLGQFKKLRGYYTKYVVKKVKSGSTLVPDYDHKDDAGKIPLPATMIHDLSKIMEKEEGSSLSLYSLYPFPNRKLRRLDPFQSNAWDLFTKGSNTTVSDTFQVGETTVMRVAIADVMQTQACVDCHNNHPLSPKIDWKLGDVRGVLELSTDITNQMSLANELSNAIVASIVGAGIVLIALFSWMTRRITGPIGNMTSAMSQLIKGDYSVKVEDHSHIFEIDQMAKTVTGFKMALIKCKQTEEDLNKTVQELNFQKHALDEHAIVSITDVYGNITYANDKFCLISGYEQDELLGQNHRLLKSDEHSSDLFSKLWNDVVDGKIWFGELKNRRKDGGYFWVSATMVPFPDEHGNPTQYVAICTDITEKKESELALISATEKAESASIAKSNFLSTMSHEIRTPLNGVLGLAQLLTDTNLDKDQKQKVEIILSSGHTLLAIINDVLEISKIEAGGIELEEKAFNLKNLVSIIASPFQSLADEKGLKLRVIEKVSSDLALSGDPVRLRQILWNLLSNAIKFTNSGSVTLTIDNDDHTNDKRPDTKRHQLHFTVSDSGNGIAPDRVDAIFDAFTQEDSSITRKHGGTGLGLSIVKQLTELMGGTINVTSELGTGTSFDVSIPFNSASREDAETVFLKDMKYNAQSNEPLNVLIAEDNDVNALIARSFLEKVGHNVKRVENGKQAVDAAREQWADLILMDIHMPEMNGIEATKIIRSTPSGEALPIVGLTAEAFVESHAEFIRAGMNGILTKPFTEQQLMETLGTHRKSRKDTFN